MNEEKNLEKCYTWNIVPAKFTSAVIPVKGKRKTEAPAKGRREYSK
jgi:hypothetical protein